MNVPLADVSGKGAFVSGGSSGIGLGIVRAFAEADMKVAFSYQTKAHLDQAMAYLGDAAQNVRSICVDVRDRYALKVAATEVAQFLDKLHVLVNNAGVAQHMSLMATTYDDWDWQIDINLNGVFNCIKTFLPMLQAHGEGAQIVTTSSILGLFSGADSACYSTTKFAVVGMMEGLRADLQGSNIGASIFLPGLVVSNMADALRNRCDSLSDTGAVQDAERTAQERAHRQNLDYAMDQMEAGKLVLDGIRNNRLYIISHPEYLSIVDQRQEMLRAASKWGSPSTPVRDASAARMLENSPYR